jgi:hypothetical protein
MYQEQKGKYEEEASKAKAAGEDAAAVAAAADSAAADKRNLAALTHGFRDSMLEAMQGRRYVPAVDEGVRACLRQLGWWRGYSGLDL